MQTRRTCVWVTLLGAVLLAAPGAARAQDNRGAQQRSREIVIGEALTIRSEVLDEDRVIRVGKPADYYPGFAGSIRRTRTRGRDTDRGAALDTYNRFGIEGIEHFFAKSDKTYGYARGVPQPVGAALARELLASGRLDEVADLLARYRERMRPPAAVVERLAAAYRERGRIDRAIDLYRQALQTNPKSEVSRRALTELGHDFSDLVR